jgi:Tol biopolymer transport system component
VKLAKQRWVSLLPVALVLATSIGVTSAKALPPVYPVGMKVTFAGKDLNVHGQNEGFQQLFSADAGGANLQQITQYDGNYYDWAEWAMGGTKIVFTRKNRLPIYPHDNVGEESIWMMDPDGTHRVRLTTNAWRNLQPKISTDGRTMLFGSYWNEFPVLGIYKMDLATAQVSSLSMITHDGGLDADPRFSPDGTQIIFASGFTDQGAIPTQIYRMNVDGTGREQITHDNYFNSDPDISPDGRYAVYAQYRGKDTPLLPGDNKGFIFPLSDWYLVSQDLQTGTLRDLTHGAKCDTLLPPDQCSPTAGGGWVPHWSPDGQRIGFLAVLNVRRTGIYTVLADGSDPQPLVETDHIGIAYWDWAMPGQAPAGAVDAIGMSVPKSQLLISGRSLAANHTDLQPAAITVTTPDRWLGTPVTLPDGTAPENARWSPDKKLIVFSARRPVDPSKVVLGPAPPPGQSVHVHFTLSLLQPLIPPLAPSNDYYEQIYIANADGSNLRQLTTPGTEDYLDALEPNDLRANSEPDFSPDGRYVVFTNRSTLHNESFLVRLDLKTGEVFNLTSATSGAVPVVDAHPRYSPNGSLIAFQTGIGSREQIMLMDAATGLNVRQLTDDDFFNVQPAWSPDGTRLAYASYRGTGLPIDTGDITDAMTAPGFKTTDWSLVKLDLNSRASQVLVGPGILSVLPVWSPDGTQIAFISAGHSRQADVFVVNADGTGGHAVAETLITREESVDWR